MRPALLTAVALAIGCRGIDGPRPMASLASTTPFVVSTPHSDSALATLSGSSGREVAWVALPAQAITNADDVTVRVESTGQSVTAKARDGGLDPLPVFAVLGDQLRLTVTSVGGSVISSYGTAITGSKGPTVIRTSPPPTKRDVPLNAVIVVVFSEPLSDASLTAGVMTLTTGGTPVGGQLSFADPTHVAILFTPNAPLAAATDYTLTVTQGIKNLDGQVLRAPAVVQFTTTASSSVMPSMPFDVSAAHPSYTPDLGYADVVWVAVPAGMIGNVSRVNVVSTSPVGAPAGANTGKVSDGGLDPLPVGAALGDQLHITLWTDSMAVVSSFDVSVASSKGPGVVRTSPSKAQRDVPTNAVVLGVFSEPLSAASVTPGTLSLTSGGTPVAGQLSFGDSAHLTIMFTPDAPLAPATDYTLTVTQGIKNLDGQALREPVVVQFTTTSSSSAPPSGVAKFHVSGMVTDDANTPLSGATLYFWIYPLPGQLRQGEVFVTTDGNGKFTADFTSVAGSIGEWPGLGDAIAFAFAWKDGYLGDDRYVLASRISDLQFKLYRPQWVTAGDSVLMTVTPHDAACVNNSQEFYFWYEPWHCRTIFVSPSSVDGSLLITTQCQTTCPTIGLHAEVAGTVPNADSLYIARFGTSLFNSLFPATGTLTVPLLHGIPMQLSVEVPWLGPQATTWVRTSFTPTP